MTDSSSSSSASSGRPGLKKIPPYWYPYRTNAKARWFDREILEVVSTEFRDRSVEYYRYALQSGVTTINGKIALPGTIIRNGDTLENIVHRHEPPVTSTPVEILYHNKERDFVVINKPGSIPVHAAGRYFKNSLVEILKDNFGFQDVYTVNRLDRLTSGLMIIALSADRARTLTSEFTSGTIRKEYVARVRGEFPSEEITCEEPLLTIDRQMGLNIVHPDGKEAKTVFTRMHYDKVSDTSVVHCRPFTGRSHQIRVHLQYLGHPIANDAVYADARIWGPRLGKGGIDFTPSDKREAPKPPPEYMDSTAEGKGRSRLDIACENDPSSSKMRSANSFEGARNEPNVYAVQDQAVPKPQTRLTPAISELSPNVFPSPKRKKAKMDKRANPAFRTKEESAALTASHTGEPPALLPRETGHDIGLGAPVPLSSEAVGVITRMRNQKDEDEDWSRWRDVVFRAKVALHPREYAQGWAQQKPNPKRGRGKNKNKSKNKLGNDVEITESCQGREPTADDVFASDDPVPDAANERADPAASSSPNPEIEGATEKNSQHDPNPASLSALSQSIDALSLPAAAPSSSPETDPEHQTKAEFDTTSGSDALYCPECYLPLHPDPKPEKLYIFLHALRYTSASLGAFETCLPEWAAEGYVWE